MCVLQFSGRKFETNLIPSNAEDIGRMNSKNCNSWDKNTTCQGVAESLVINEVSSFSVGLPLGMFYHPETEKV